MTFIILRLVSFHRIRFCWNEPIFQLKFKWDLRLDAANLRPALKHVCGKQTPSASILFFHENLVYDFNVKMLSRMRSRSVQLSGTCKKYAAAQCRLSIKKRAWLQNSWEAKLTLCKKWNVSARRLLPKAMLKVWAHVCRTKITLELLPTDSDWFISTKTKSMKWHVNWSGLRAYSGGFNDAENYDQDKYGFKWQT